ncbi:Ubiquitin-conjugating enzyme E2 pex4 [Penicillium antarcticum]|uniref:Ubiquitin-conjugating enzyme E2 pex4 n=1 Tax=Penicillium antarcticum TaxID=416450 RepID=UPI00238A933A|nr:Ubiquitin-conjugating enzyme E2 pex4 [Penicillium antarcticum]KAJ5306011.1 Ubiquitin-conjugating enzyme E2 pex4 [Penicillium antarcticum]
MSGPSSNTTQRLIRELKDYSKSPNEALLHLGPVDDEDLLRWEAVLKGVNGTPYEGESHSIFNPQPVPKSYSLSIAIFHSIPPPLLSRPQLAPQLTNVRWALAPPNLNSTKLSPLPTDNPLHDTHIAPKHLIQHGRDLPDALDDGALESGVYTFDDVDSDPAIIDGPTT